jgi:hypothetical protein
MTISCWVRSCFVAVLFVGLTGCGSGIHAGKALSFPKEKDAKVFSVGTVAETTMTNREGIAINGLIINEASLILSPAELTKSKSNHYVIFWDLLLGGMVESRYWEQTLEMHRGLGSRAMHTHYTTITSITTDSNQVVLDVKKYQVAHVRISVNTNDFGRKPTL